MSTMTLEAQRAARRSQFFTPARSRAYWLAGVIVSSMIYGLVTWATWPTNTVYKAVALLGVGFLIGEVLGRIRAFLPMKPRSVEFLYSGLVKTEDLVVMSVTMLERVEAALASTSARDAALRDARTYAFIPFCFRLCAARWSGGAPKEAEHTHADDLYIPFAFGIEVGRTSKLAAAWRGVVEAVETVPSNADDLQKLR